MEKIVGNVISKSSGKSYQVKWNSEEQISLVKGKSNTWEIVCTNVRSAEEALTCAQGVIDSQHDLY